MQRYTLSQDIYPKILNLYHNLVFRFFEKSIGFSVVFRFPRQRKSLVFRKTKITQPYPERKGKRQQHVKLYEVVCTTISCVCMCVFELRCDSYYVVTYFFGGGRKTEKPDAILTL